MGRNAINKLIYSLLVCSLLFASGAFVSAEDNNELIDDMKSASLVQRAPAPTVLGYKHVDFNAVIDKLVEEGKLSKEKAVQIEKFMQQKREEQKGLKDGEKRGSQHGHKYEIVKELVEAKIISNVEAEMISSKFREIREAVFNEKLIAMVQNGAITQAQADKVKSYFENARKEKVEMHKKLQKMTEEQRKAFFKEYKKDDFMNKLIEDGVLTKEQVQELRSSFKEKHKGKYKEH